MSKPLSRPGKTGTLILLIIFLINTGLSCKKSEIQLVPFESRKFIIEYLPDGNVVVKPGMLLTHFELMVKALTLKLQVKALLERLKKLEEK